MARDFSLELEENILHQANYFLNEADEFNPFGAVIDSNNQLKPVGFFVDDAFPESAIIINALENEIKTGIEQNRYQQGAIGIDTEVSVKQDDSVETKTAIEIRSYGIDTYAAKHFKYFKDCDGYHFEDH